MKNRIDVLMNPGRGHGGKLLEPLYTVLGHISFEQALPIR